MKKLFALCLSVLLIVSALSGCGDKIVRPTQLPSASSATEQSPAAETADYPVALTAAEIANFQTTLSSMENYGFLLSDYSNVIDADLYQIFYTGAGMNNPQNSSEIVNAYLTASGEGNPDCDATVLTTQQINDFLMLKTGHSLSDMKSTLGWAYIEQYDAYLHFHGDTNYVPGVCIGGRLIGENLYEIEYTFDGGIYDDNSNLLTGGTVTVKNTGDKMQFVSNSLH